MPGERTQEQIEAALMAGDDDDLLDLPAGDGEEGGEGDAAAEAEAARVAAEAEASRKGWTPKDKFKGDPAKWVDAQTFIERGERFTKNLQREIADLKAQAAESAKTKVQFAKFMQERLDAKDAELKDAIQALRVQRSAATQDGDHELAVQLEDRIELLKDQQKEVKKEFEEVKPTPTPQERQPGPNPDDPVLLDWIEDGNQWFKDDPKLQAYAVAVGEEMIKEGQRTGVAPPKGRPFLDAVRKEMEVQFPRRFAQQQQAGKQAPPVETGSRASGNTGIHTARDLPPEDRKLMRQFVAEGMMTEEQYLKNYFGSADKGRRHS